MDAFSAQHPSRILGGVEATEQATVQRLLESLTIPSDCPRVVSTLFSVRPDSTGDAAVWVWVILADREEDWTLAEVRPLTELIEGALTEGGVRAIPYVRFRTESEQILIDEQRTDPPDGRIERL